jgi:hypothetical protein
MSINLAINTNFEDKSKLLAHIRRSKFINQFVNILKENPNSKNHKFNPVLEEGKDISNPQNLYYSEIPRYSIPFIDLVEVNIHQKWVIKDNLFTSNINVDLKGSIIFKILLNFKIKDEKNRNKIIIELNSKWVEKIFIIPDFILENITKQVKLIIERLVNKN